MVLRTGSGVQCRDRDDAHGHQHSATSRFQQGRVMPERWSAECGRLAVSLNGTRDAAANYESSVFQGSSGKPISAQSCMPINPFTTMRDLSCCPRRHLPARWTRSSVGVDEKQREQTVQVKLHHDEEHTVNWTSRWSC